MTTPNLYDEKEVMEEFISCYRHFTALWDNTSTDYLSKKKKEPGHQELLKILRRVNRHASVHDVKRKINSLRCCYRRELRKIQSSYKGYEPRLWWFHMMEFLNPVLNLNVHTTSSRMKHEIKSMDDSLDEASLHAQSYDRLLRHMLTIDPNANIHMVKRKINNLRTSYRRELRKVLESKSSPNGGEEYVPSLWYFNELEFLYDQETGEAQTLIDSQHHPEQEYEAELEPVPNRARKAPTDLGNINDMEYHKQRVSLSYNENLVMLSVEPEPEPESEPDQEPDEDIFAEPFPPEEDMLVIEGEGDVEGEDDGDGGADADDLGMDAKHETLSEGRHKCDQQMDGKYQQHSNANGSVSGSGNNNNRNTISSSSSKHSMDNGNGKHAHPHPYMLKRRQQQQQTTSRSSASQQVRRRQRSSDGDAEDDYDDDSARVSKKRRQALERSMENTENECDLIGKRMAAHFRNMRADQRLFAERIIGEVLVFGRMNRLSLNARFLPNGMADLDARDDYK